MNRTESFKTRIIGKALAVAASLSLLAVFGNAQTLPADTGHALYLETNSASSNAILVYTENVDGTLTLQEAVSTGGKGNGAGLGQGALAINKAANLLYAVNAGSNDISVFQIDHSRLSLLQTISSEGTMPISITEFDNVVYVLDAGGTAHIAGFTWDWVLGLQPLRDSSRTLSKPAPTPVQIGFSEHGDSILVTEKVTNMIDVFPVDPYGMVGVLRTFKSSGVTPFGFAFGYHNLLVVSNANGGTANASSGSSYHLEVSTTLKPASSAIPTNQTSACWTAVTHDGRFAYFADAGSSAVSGFSINFDGALKPLILGGTTATDPHPIDMALSFNDQFLYVVSNNGGAIDEFIVLGDGSLSPLGSITGLPTSVSGAAEK